MQVCVCCSMCVGGDDDLLLLATEVGVVQTSVRGGSAQVIAPRASDGSSGKDATVAELQASYGSPTYHSHPLLANTSCTFLSMSMLCDLKFDCRVFLNEKSTSLA